MAAGAFAIDLGNGFSLEGEVKAGVRVFTEDDGYTVDPDDVSATAPTKNEVDQKENSDNTQASLWNEDAGQVLRTRLVFNYSGDKAGVKIRLNSDDGSTSPVVNKAYGWANFLDKKLVVYGGRGFDDLWGLGKLHINAFDPSLDGITGVRVAVNVVDNLSFGFGLPLDQVSYATSYSTGWTTGKANRTLGALFGGAVIGGLYKTDFISAAAGLKLYPAINSKDYGAEESSIDHDNNPATDDKKEYGETPAYVEVIAGVSVKPIDPLVVVLDAHIDSRKYTDELSFFGDNKIGFARIGVKGEYDVIPALTASLKLDLLLQNEKAERAASGNEQITQYYDAKKNIPLTQENYVKYVPVETYGDPSLGFEIGATYKATDTISAYLNIGSENLLWIAGDVEYNKTDATKWTYSPGAGIYVQPGVTIDLGGPSIEIFDKIDKIGASDLWYTYTESGDTKDGTTSPVTNQFQVEFVWKF